MQLGGPWFLAGLAALGIPLYVHLLRRFQRTPQAFPSLRFFEKRVQSDTRSRRLRYLALLSLRLLLLALLVGAFTDPYLTRFLPAAKTRPLTVIAVDRTFSMRAGNHLDEAKKRAHQAVRNMPGSARGEILGVDARTEALTRPEADHGLLDAAINAIQPTDEAGSFADFARSLRAMESSSGQRLEAYFFTDAQQSSMPASFADLQTGSRTSLHVVRIDKGVTPNWAVQSVEATALVHDSNSNRVVAHIAGWNASPTKKKVQLLLDGKVIAERDAAVSDCGPTSVEFDGVVVPYGLHRGEVRISPQDDLPQDDAYAFTLEHQDKRPVLFVYAHDRIHEALYYGAALSSGNTAFDLVVHSVQQLAGEDLAKYAYVVLNDPGALPSDAERALEEYVKAGGSVLIAIGPNTAREHKVPLTEEDLRDDVATQTSAWSDRSIPDLGPARFITASRITPGPAARTLSKLVDGSPLLTEEALGQGRILVFATTMDDAGSDLPLHPSFVPFVQQTARMLSGSEEMQSSYSAGSSIALRRDSGVRNANESTAADVIAPDGSHPLTLSQAARAASYRLDRTGFFEIHRTDGRRFLAAVNSDRRESDLTPVPAETLALWNSAPVRGDGVVVEQAAEKISFWPYILGTALLAFLAESVFASHYLRRERNTT